MILPRQTRSAVVARSRPGGAFTRARRAFTLLEILLVLALFALFGGLLVGGAVSMLDTSSSEDPEEALLEIIQTVRRDAVTTGRTIELRPVEEGAAFVWDGGHEVLPEREDVKATLIKPQLDNAVLIGGFLEETPIEFVRFYPDGTCDPMRMQVRRGRERRVLTIDPWTCAVLPEVQTR